MLISPCPFKLFQGYNNEQSWVKGRQTKKHLILLKEELNTHFKERIVYKSRYNIKREIEKNRKKIGKKSKIIQNDRK